MTIQTSEINGFLIDTFNIHKLVPKNLIKDNLF